MKLIKIGDVYINQDHVVSIKPAPHAPNGVAFHMLNGEVVYHDLKPDQTLSGFVEGMVRTTEMIYGN